eukprot:Pgem_evm1s18446
MIKVSRRRYELDLVQFVKWIIEAFNISYNIHDTSFNHDILFLHYICYKFEESDKFFRHCNTIRVALQHFNPSLYGKLPICIRALKGWKKYKGDHSIPPLPFSIFKLLCIFLSLHNQIDYMLIIYLSFAGLLRISETLSLRFTDITISNNIIIQFAKTGTNQYVHIDDPFLLKLFRMLFKNILQTFNLHNFGFSSHSLRHGSAVKLFLDGVSIYQIKLRGRWASLKTVERYLQIGK